MDRFSRILRFKDFGGKYYRILKTIISPRFLYELVVPQDVFSVASKLNISDGHDEKVFRFILAASIFNGIFVGLPGTIGWGVIVSQVVEFLMVVNIALMVGLVPSIENISVKKILNLVSATGVAAVSIFYGFKLVLKVVFNVVGTFVPQGFATASAEIITTLFFGLFIYLAFLEIRNTESGHKLSFSRITAITLNAGTYTRQISLSLFNLVFRDTPRLFSELKDNVIDAWNGVVSIKPKYQGDLFLMGCFAFLLEGKYVELSGPFSALWMDAWRQAFPRQLGPDATPEEIGSLANSYSSNEIENIRRNVDAKFYEILETTHENADGDEWSAELMEGQNHPVSDALFFNSESGKTIEINYKFSESADYIESHIARHPGVPVVAPPEIAEKINSPYVMPGEYGHEAVLDISEENFESVFEAQISGMGPALVASGGLDFAIRAFPFCSAYFRGKITRDQFTKVIGRLFPKVSARVINRIAMLTLLGPVYGMFLLASLGLKGTLHDFPEGPVSMDTEAPVKPEKREATPLENTAGLTRRELITLSFNKDIE